MEKHCQTSFHTDLSGSEHKIKIKVKKKEKSPFKNKKVSWALGENNGFLEDEYLDTDLNKLDESKLPKNHIISKCISTRSLPAIDSARKDQTVF